MKRIFALLLTFILTIMPGLTSYAVSGPCDSYDPVSRTGVWSYIKVTPTGGDTSRTAYIYSNYTTNAEGVVSKVKGATYNKKKNTLTFNNYKQEDVVLTVHNMGTSFKLTLKGKKNKLRSIKVTNDNGWESGIKINGSGTIVIGNSSDHSNVPLDVSGCCNLAAGKIKLIAEKEDPGSGMGLRFTLAVSDKKNDKPFKTKMKYNKKKVTINTFVGESGGATTSSKDTITFTKKK